MVKVTYACPTNEKEITLPLADFDIELEESGDGYNSYRIFSSLDIYCECGRYHEFDRQGNLKV